MNTNKKIPLSNSHKTPWLRFVFLCFLFIGYFAYLSIQYDIITGGITSLLTWSFFVLCTPVADAGFLLDFPIRLLFGWRMAFSELFVWSIALSTSIISLNYFPVYYQTTPLTQLFHTILITPYPYWGIIILSTIGTFLSVMFGDEILDVFSKKDKLTYLKQHKHKLILLVLVYGIVIFVYYQLLIATHINKII